MNDPPTLRHPLYATIHHLADPSSAENPHQGQVVVGQLVVDLTESGDRDISGPPAEANRRQLERALAGPDQDSPSGPALPVSVIARAAPT
jgi:hypothetical protein